MTGIMLIQYNIVAEITKHHIRMLYIGTVSFCNEYTLGSFVCDGCVETVWEADKERQTRISTCTSYILPPL